MMRIPLLAFVFVTLSQAMLAAEPPNLVLMMGDDHGWEETSYNGHPHVTGRVGQSAA